MIKTHQMWPKADRFVRIKSVYLSGISKSIFEVTLMMWNFEDIIVNFIHISLLFSINSRAVNSTNVAGTLSGNNFDENTHVKVCKYKIYNNMY